MVSRVELRPSGFHGKCLYLLCHLARPLFKSNVYFSTMSYMYIMYIDHTPHIALPSPHPLLWAPFLPNNSLCTFASLAVNLGFYNGHWSELIYWCIGNWPVTSPLKKVTSSPPATIDCQGFISECGSVQYCACDHSCSGFMNTAVTSKDHVMTFLLILVSYILPSHFPMVFPELCREWLI